MKNNQIKNHIINKSAQIFLNQGYTKTTTKQIANICGISEGALFRTFKDKESIYLEIISEIVNKKILSLNNVNDYFKLLVILMNESNQNQIIKDLLIQLFSLNKTKKYLNEEIAKFYYNKLNKTTLKEYYELEVALSGIYLSYLNLETNMYFDIDYKINRYIEIISLLIQEENININSNINYKNDFNRIYNVLESYFNQKGGDN